MDAYLALLQKQNGKCAICGTKDFGKKAPNVDHCHATGVIRGLLCCSCNRGIGLLKDDPELLLKAAGYLLGDTAAGLRKALRYLKAG